MSSLYESFSFSFSFSLCFCFNFVFCLNDYFLCMYVYALERFTETNNCIILFILLFSISVMEQLLQISIWKKLSQNICMIFFFPFHFISFFWIMLFIIYKQYQFLLIKYFKEPTKYNNIEYINEALFLEEDIFIDNR